MKVCRVMTTSGSFGLIKGQMRFLKENGWVVIVVSGEPEEKLAELEKEEGVRSILVHHLVRPISILNDIKALFQLIKIFRDEKPTMVHANTPKASLLSMLASWWCRVPHRLYTVTGLRFETTTGFKRWLLITMERITCACATIVIPEGDGVKATLIREKITKKPLQKIHNGNINGIDLVHFRMSEKIEEQAKRIRETIGGNFIFLFVGRIVRDKGIVELINAFTRVNRENPDTRLLLVGNMEPELDPLPQTTLKVIREYPAIFEAGYQNDVRPYFAAADIFTFPSYREGFPNVVLQAGAMGLPSIVTDINGCNEIIIMGENGTIIPKANSNALYEAMKCLYQEKGVRLEMATKARSLIASRYKQENVWQATLALYDNLLTR